MLGNVANGEGVRPTDAFRYDVRSVRSVLKHLKIQTLINRYNEDSMNSDTPRIRTDGIQLCNTIVHHSITSKNIVPFLS